MFERPFERSKVRFRGRVEKSVDVSVGRFTSGGRDERRVDFGHGGAKRDGGDRGDVRREGDGGEVDRGGADQVQESEEDGGEGFSV